MAKRRSNTAARSPWYTEGLRFACDEDCGACCTDHGKYAYIYLDGDDADRLAAHLGLAKDRFDERYTDVDDGDLILRMDGPDCSFLDGSRCAVYDARPTQCKTFPFWRENLKSRRSWSSLGEFCPGIDQGERHALPVIRARLAEREIDG